MSDPLLQGLRLYEPATFLFPANYILMLVNQTAVSAAVTLALGLWIGFAGFLVRRLTATLLTSGLGWALGGMLAMSLHWSFVAITWTLAALGAAAGLRWPRASLALVEALLFAVCLRALGLWLLLPIFEEMPFEMFAASFALMFAVGVIAWYSWICFSCALLGATLITYSLPALLGQVLDVFSPMRWGEMGILYGVLLTVFAFAGLVVQMRVGMLPRPRWLRVPSLQKARAKNAPAVKG